jgi:hypothetical protein
MTEALTTTTATEATDAALNAFAETLPEPQANAFRTLWGHMQAENQELRETVASQGETIDEQTERIDTLETEIEIQSSNVGGCHSRVSDLTERVEDVEAHSGDDTPRVDTGETGVQNDETPLYRICVLPEHIAERELTANQERARFIAKDVRDYAEKCPAGLVIDSRAIKRVLTAKEGKRPHTQTVARVMNFLDEFGKDGVELKKRRGNKLIAFTPEFVNQLEAANHSRCDRGTGETPSEAVIPTG